MLTEGILTFTIFQVWRIFPCFHEQTKSNAYIFLSQAERNIHQALPAFWNFFLRKGIIIIDSPLFLGDLRHVLGNNIFYLTLTYVNWISENSTRSLEERYFKLGYFFTAK